MSIVTNVPGQAIQSTAMRAAVRFKAVQGIAVQTVAIAAFSAVWSSILPSISELFSQLRNPNCLIKNCPDLSQSTLRPKEIAVYDAIHPLLPRAGDTWQEDLRFRKNDPREKLLYFSSESDHNGALEPSTVSSLLQSLDRDFDIKFVVVRNSQEICKEIKEAVRAGELKHVVIHGHGNPFFTELGANPTSTSYLIPNEEHTNCFSDLKPEGKILLISCSTGRDTEEYIDAVRARGTTRFEVLAESWYAGAISISEAIKSYFGFSKIPPMAQKLADLSKRTVLAPTRTALSTVVELESSEGLKIFHAESLLDLFTKKNNIFRSFYPRFSDCEATRSLHPKEQAVIDVLKKTKVSPGSEEEALRLCKDNPKDKVLILSAFEDQGKNDLDPRFKENILKPLFDEFDLKYKVIKSFDQICQEIKQASTYGKLAYVFIDAHGLPKLLFLSRKALGTEQDLASGQDVLKDGNLRSCFSDIDSMGRIILLGGNTGSKISGQNLAEKIAQEANRTVLAPTEPVHHNKIQLKSLRPLEIFHPKGYFNKTNLFKEFLPTKDK